MRSARVGGDRLYQAGWAVFTIYLLALGIASALRSQGDFAIYYLAGQRILSGATVYPASDSNHFLYAPVIAIFFAPFSLLPIRAAQVAWFVFNAAGLVAFVAGSKRLLFGSGWPAPWIVFLPIVFCTRFINNNIEHGQINLIVMGMIVWSLVLAESRPPLSGLLLAASILIKPFALLAGWYLLLQRRWASIAWSAVAGVALLGAAILFMGPSHAIGETADYLKAIAATGNRYPLMLTNQSASSAAMRLFSAASSSLSLGVAAALGTGLEILLLIFISIWIVRASSNESSRSRMLTLAALFCLMPSIAPVSWKSYYVALLLPYMAVLSAFLESRIRVGWLLWLALGLSVTLNFLPGRTVNHLALFYSAHFISSLLLMAICFAAARETNGSSNTGSRFGGQHDGLNIGS